MPVVTPDELFRRGLLLVGFNGARIENVKRSTNLGRFCSHYGSNPIVYVEIWQDLQTTDIPDARITTDEQFVSLDSFLLAIHFLNCFPTEPRLAATFKVCEKTARKCSWFFAKKLQDLKASKVGYQVHRFTLNGLFRLTIILPCCLQIVWPEHWAPGSPSIPTFLLSVDGVHCRIQEPKHPTQSKDPSYYSHKFNQSGLDYELGIAMYENKLVWMNGPFKASRSDTKIFERGGLRDMIPPGHRVIADGGYKSNAIVLSTRNSHDPKELSKFKRRARARHESFNGRIKNFKCLAERFRHGNDKFAIAFEAVCVIVQYQLDNGSPLFDT